MTHRVLMAAATLAAMSGSAFAQFSSDPANNLTVANRSGDQVQPKIRATADGGSYVSWFDNSTGGYDVYLQRLDARGVEQWAHNGILICDRSVSSTTDYDLQVDAAGNAVLSYNSDSNNIAVQKVSPAGVLQWPGASGVVLTTGTSFRGSPHIAPLTDGAYAVAWTDGSSTPSGWAMQVVSSAGVPRFASPIQVSESGHYTGFSDIKPSDNGSYIVMWIRAFNTSSLTSKYLLAQKYDGNGAAQWTPTPTTGNSLGPVTGVIVYMPAPGSTYTYNGGSGTYSATQGGSIQNGYQPPMISDGAGGVVIGWYENAGPRNAYIQHIHSDGSLQFQLNGVSNAFTALSPGRIRIDAAAAYDPVGPRYYLASAESANPTQGNYSSFVNSFSAAGARLWGDTGVTIIPIGSTTQTSFTQCQAVPTGCVVGGFDARSATTMVVYAAKVQDFDQSIAWSIRPSSTAVSKSRLTSCVTPVFSNGGGDVIFAWGNGATGSSDIQVQNVHNDGTLGVLPNCGGPDFNGDGDIGTDQDIEAFFRCLAGDCCATCYPGGPDFNGDGDIGTDQDIEAFFRVLAGNPC